MNHFKSKGSGPEDPNGQGGSNEQRVAQADELIRFAEQMKDELGTEKVFLSGDFNAYTREDPMRRLYDNGYTDIGSDQSPDEHTYLFDGLVGSLDHVLGNEAALETVTGAHVWNMSSVEPVALEYSRHNYNATDFYDPGPYRSSDHDPLVVGLDLPMGAVATQTSASVSPNPVKAGVDRPVVTARVTSRHGTIDEGQVAVREGPRLLGVAQVHEGIATLTLSADQRMGQHRLNVTYLGTGEARGSQASTSFKVVKPG